MGEGVWCDGVWVRVWVWGQVVMHVRVRDEGASVGVGVQPYMC